MAMCLRCMQEGKYVDENDCSHDKPTLSTHEPEDKPKATRKNKKVTE